MKIVIIYDTKTGNTELMAEAIGEGVGTVADVEVKKIGERFPLTILADVDGVIFGSPVYYADVSNNLKEFFANIKSYIETNKKIVNKIPAAIFGSYGYDGAWLMEEKLKKMTKELGYIVYDDVLVMIDTDIKYHFESEKAKAKEFGKKFAESI